jgi:hypothetical protein
VSAASGILETLNWFERELILITPSTKLLGTWAKLGDTKKLMSERRDEVWLVETGSDNATRLGSSLLRNSRVRGAGRLGSEHASIALSSSSSRRVISE